MRYSSSAISLPFVLTTNGYCDFAKTSKACLVIPSSFSMG
nr:MAG TPA: hypothetical protein [Caudoviricetes sp.]